jgi:Holliday junction resolvasome RuvABC endonuclease subunit
MAHVRLLAADPALRHGGHCIIEGDPWNEGDPPYGWKVLDVGSYELPTKKPAMLDWPDGRCYLIWDRRIMTALTRFRPTAVFVEGIGGVDFSANRNLRSGHVLAGVRAGIERLAYEYDVPYFAPFAGKIKQSLAQHASAPKEEVAATLARLGLYQGPQSDEADAIAVAWYGMKAIRAGEIILPEGARV